MYHEHRWDPCVSHQGCEVISFISDYFSLPCRKVLLLAGAGFDPRSTTLAIELVKATENLRAFLIREDRPDPPEVLLDLAEENLHFLKYKIKEHYVAQIEIFGEGGAIVGGRNVISLLRQISMDEITDVVIDSSALSVGTSFPIIRYFFELVRKGSRSLNIHVFVAHDPQLDADIRSVPCDAPGYIHGFRGRSSLDDQSSAARLWLPQLETGCRSALSQLFEFIAPHDTCPILPFPATNPRLIDILSEEYLDEFENTWSVDTNNIVYADEGNPLDLYRTILTLDDLRKRVFAETGGSLLVLSPIGSKVMALGALMAALERDLPVTHLESLSYELQTSDQRPTMKPKLIHIWLEGEVYPARC